MLCFTFERNSSWSDDSCSQFAKLWSLNKNNRQTTHPHLCRGLYSKFQFLVPLIKPLVLSWYYVYMHSLGNRICFLAQYKKAKHFSPVISERSQKKNSLFMFILTYSLRQRDGALSGKLVNLRSYSGFNFLSMSLLSFNSSL